MVRVDCPKEKMIGLTRRIAARGARKSSDTDQEIPGTARERVSRIVESPDAGPRENQEKSKAVEPNVTSGK
jgi:hypothetical protein